MGGYEHCLRDALNKGDQLKRTSVYSSHILNNKNMAIESRPSSQKIEIGNSIWCSALFSKTNGAVNVPADYFIGLAGGCGMVETARLYWVPPRAGLAWDAHVLTMPSIIAAVPSIKTRIIQEIDPNEWVFRTQVCGAGIWPAPKRYWEGMRAVGNRGYGMCVRLVGLEYDAGVCERRRTAQWVLIIVMCNAGGGCEGAVSFANSVLITVEMRLG